MTPEEELRNICYELLIEATEKKSDADKFIDGVHIYYCYLTDTMVIAYEESRLKLEIKDVHKKFKEELKAANNEEEN